MKTQHLLLKIAYDGTNFCGWQKQKNARTIQESIETALKEIAGKPISIIASGRTDSGVHAENQYAHFDFPTNMNPTQIRLALNSILTDEIIIKKVLRVKKEFHARYSAQKRIYRYIITTTKTPFNRFYKTFIPNKFINEKYINESLVKFKGKHNFSAFSKDNPQITNKMCEIFTLSCIFGNDTTFTIEANRFLHHMVRRIIGTIMNISRTKTNPQIIEELFKQKSSQHKLITTFPPQGLYLQEILYDKKTLF